MPSWRISKPRQSWMHGLPLVLLEPILRLVGKKKQHDKKSQ